MHAIRRHHPKAKITLLTTKPFENIAKESNYFDNIILDERPKFYQLSQWLCLRKKLNQEKFSRVYDLQNNDRTSFYFKLFSPKPEWVGTVKGASHRNTSPKRTEGGSSSETLPPPHATTNTATNANVSQPLIMSTLSYAPTDRPGQGAQQSTPPTTRPAKASTGSHTSAQHTAQPDQALPGSPARPGWPPP